MESDIKETSLKYTDSVASDYIRRVPETLSGDDCASFVLELLDSSSGPRSVIEYGVGDGRIALPMARLGIDVTGIDNSAVMLETFAGRAEAESLAVRAVAGDMTELDFQPRFTVALCAFNIIFCLNNQAEQIAFLRKVASSVHGGGFVVIEIQMIDFSHFKDNRASGPIALTETVTEYVNMLHDPVRQRIKRQVSRTEDGETSIEFMEFRYVYPSELDAMACAAGLTKVSCFSTWSGEPFVGRDYYIGVYSNVNSAVS